MNKRGDTIKIILDYSYNGEPIEDGTFDDIVFQVNEEGSEGAYTFKTSDSTITTDADSGKYCVQFDQTKSLTLPRTIKYQLTIKSSSEVYSSDIGSMTLDELLRTSEV